MVELKAEKMAVFPTLGRPTIPQFKAMPYYRTEKEYRQLAEWQLIS